VALAATRPLRRDPQPPQLVSSTVTRRSDGRLGLAVTAPDQLGFLGRLLGRISVLGLLPVEVDISTVGALVSDRFVLIGLRSGTVDADVAEALEGMLRGFSRP
jgi:UTP:GlnB (protein PII) uridylyltransferase